MVHRVFEKALELIGNTPMMALDRIAAGVPCRVWGKLESVNPGGSVKDRIALAVVEDAESRDLLSPGDTLVWATSGNTGVSLAMVAAAKGYHLAIFMPSNTPLNYRRLLQRYGAEVQLTSPGAGMQGSHEAARNRAVQDDQALWLDMFNHPAIVEVHQKQTAEEIIRDTGGAVDAFVAGVGTGGTITGVGLRLKEACPGVRVVAVEPAGSPVLSGGPPGRHMIPGIGADFPPPLLRRDILDSIIGVSDAEAASMSLRLAREESLLVGLSSGANVAAALQVAQTLGSGQTVVTMLPDSGERYLDFPI